MFSPRASRVRAVVYDLFLEIKVTSAGTLQASLERVYNSEFPATQLKLNGQLLASFSYDNDGLLTQAGPLAITRDPQTGFWLSSQAGVVQESRSFDAYGQLQSQEFKVSGASILKITYERDNLGRITAKNEERPSGITRFEYGYDPAGRLVSERKILPDGSSLLTQWSYDGNGNRVMEVKPNGTAVTGSYDDQDRLLQYGDLSFTHTANRELISKCQGSVSQYFDYDVFANLRHVILDNGMEIEYVIDGRNRRIGKKINGTLVQGFIYDDQLRILAELDGQNQVVAKFTYADQINVPEVMEKGGRTYRVLHDHLGSPRFVIDTQTGQIVQELHYDAWGNVVFDSNPGFQPFGFVGGLYDNHTKLVRFGARDYDPQVGRWTSKDPLGIEWNRTNLFDYAAGQPLNVADPAGKSIVSPGFPAPMDQLPCAKRVADQLVQIIPEAWSDKFKHCVISCLIAKYCGPFGSLAAGGAKELKDLLDRNPNTHPEKDDWNADVAGVLCAMMGANDPCNTCFCCCSKRGYSPWKK
ncbi:hypothetical protein EG19_11300 [Thermoanaerobaculum aquaticum]|uniref:Teneurin-like YD-shell domain-containing protein n=1 Tax=Thermoanaerobaculum aquaticum TaxID=1312852 RepID=A0A062XXY3_9BACT|nr:hypothetical protein EG19_11300 [Thermoanaerobaculum aquaticum]